jgi:signal transduction histidine kinase
MPSPFTRYRENPFFRSTMNVIIVQSMFVLLSVLVFATALWYQQYRGQQLVQEQHMAYAEGYRFTSQSLDVPLQNVRDTTLWQSVLALMVLAVIFGYFSARYALQPTRVSLEHQKRFIGNIAHELRTPLSIIRTNSEVALLDPKTGGYARTTLEGTIEELDRISGIINNLLSFDALTRPGRIRFELVDLLDIAGEVVARHRAMAQSYGINIALDSDGTPAYVMGNRIALEQALTNLTKNALNYTPQHDKRSVIVRVDNNEETVVASVIDTGIGIAQQDLYHVFQPYYRGDTSRERGIGKGTSGLGLAIVNDIVRAHSGSIVIRSALNKGTTIELSFPRLNAEPLATEPAEDDGEVHEERI